VDRLEKVADLDNEIEAHWVDSVLSDQHIPHVMRNYHFLRSDGTLQGLGVWGHVEAPLSFHAQVRRVIDEVRASSPPPAADL
jgi:hypothetical protein